MTKSDLLSKLGQVPRPTIWFGLFAAPLAWLVQLDLGLAFTPLACGGNRWPLDVLNVAALVIALAALIVALRLRGLKDQPEGAPARVTHFLGRFGAWQGAIFLLLIALTGLATLFLQACRLR